MTDNLLQIVQDACDELGLQRPSVVANATDIQVRQLYALINRDLREIQQNYDWTFLQTEFDLNVLPPIVTSGSLTKGSPVVTGIPATVTLQAQTMLCFASGLPVSTRIQSVDSRTQITLTQPSTVTAANTAITVSQDTFFGPTDFDRFINQTWWDRTNHWALLGPDSPQMDQWHRSGIVSTGPRRHFRQIGPLSGDFSSDFNVDFGGVGNQNYRLWPPPGALDSPLNIVFEYISKNIVYSAPTDSNISLPQDRFLADTDMSLLDRNILILGVKWRMWQIKGFDYSDMQQEYQDYVDRKYANDGGAKTLSLSRSSYGAGSLVQDGSFPGPTGPNVS